MFEKFQSKSILAKKKSKHEITRKIVLFHWKQPQYPFLTKMPSVHIYLHLFQFKEGTLDSKPNAFMISFNLDSIVYVSFSPS